MDGIPSKCESPLVLWLGSAPATRFQPGLIGGPHVCALVPLHGRKVSGIPGECNLDGAVTGPERLVGDT